MHDVAVVDASPLILLSRVVRLGFLRVAASRIVVPEPVLTELRAKGEDDATVRAVVCAPLSCVGDGGQQLTNSGREHGSAAVARVVELLTPVPDVASSPPSARARVDAAVLLPWTGRRCRLR